MGKPVKEEQGLIVSTSRACLTAARIRKEALLGLRMDTMEEEKKVKSRAAVTKCRVKKKREEEEKLAKMERLRKENEDISQRTAVHQQELSFLRQVVTAHVQENGQGILEAEPVLKEFLEEKDQNSG